MLKDGNAAGIHGGGAVIGRWTLSSEPVPATAEDDQLPCINLPYNYICTYIGICGMNS
jgi:hypothetical protein